MITDAQHYLAQVQYRHPDRLAARALLHTRYGRGDWFEWLTRTIAFPAGGLIADVGCGAGAFWTNAPRSVPDDLRLRLFDLSAGMIDSARAAVRGVGRWTDVEATVADATTLPLSDRSADAILAIHMLYHLADPLAGISEMARTVKDDGIVAVVLNPSGTMAELSALIDTALGREPAARREPLTSDQAMPMLHTAFAQVVQMRFEDELVVSDPVDLLAYILSLPLAENADARERIAPPSTRRSERHRPSALPRQPIFCSVGARLYRHSG